MPTIPRLSSVLAHIADDRRMKEFLNNEDIHSTTAALVSMCPKVR